MTGMYVDSSNTVLFGLSFYSLSLGYMIHRNNKLNIGTCGNNSIRLRPAWTISKTEVDEFIDKLDKTVNDC